MKVLMISGDKNMLVPTTEAYRRLELQRSHVEQLDVFVWPQVHSFWSIWKAAGATRYDVITAQDPFWRGHLAWHLTSRHHARLNIQVHTDLSAEPLWRRIWARYNLRKADSVRVVSPQLKEQIKKYITAPISVLPVFVDIERFRTITRQPHPQKTILWIGRLEDEKDPMRAIAVLEEIRKTRVDTKLIMLGEGDLKRQLQERTEELPVEFPGWQKDILPYMEIADVVLCTSRFESYGVSIIEALAAGIPVVAPDVGIAREAGAIVVPRENLAEAVVDVLQDGTKRVLKLDLPDSEEWAGRWKQTL